MIPLGDRALRFEVPGDPRVRRALSDALRAVPGVVDAVVAEEIGAVVLAPGADRAAIEHAIASLRPAAADAKIRDHVVPVVYDGEDLGEVARRTGLAAGAVADAHASGEYVVSMVGFMPGFAYLRGLDERLVLPRRESPRVRVPAGSVAMAARYTGIYPAESPGGWHLLGRTAFAPLGVLALGDRVRFEPATSIDPTATAAATPTLARGGDTEIVALQGVGLVVGPARHGRMHEGVPPGGPLVEDAFARAGADRAIELYGSMTLATPDGRVTIGSGPRARVAYVGLVGDAPIGARVRRGDRITVAGTSSPRAPAREARIAIAPGPDDVGRDAEGVLLASAFRVAAASNRVGTRLEGPPVPAPDARPDRASAPMVKGAIELTPSGLVVLGPDHPTTGGYPVVAVVRDAAMDAFFALPVGATLRFVIA